MPEVIPDPLLVTKRVRKCQVGHSEVSVPAESATPELQFDVSFKTVRSAEVKLWDIEVRW